MGRAVPEENKVSAGEKNSSFGDGYRMGGNRGNSSFGNGYKMGVDNKKDDA